MINEIAHHKYGPSKLENYDPKSGGCAAFEASGGESEKATYGSLKHAATATRDLSLLGGDANAEAEVSRMIEFIEFTREEYPVVFSEVTLSAEKIFGTLDHLGLDESGREAIIIDAKFGAWSVTPAKDNLQGWAYCLLTFLNYPSVNKIRLIFYAAKTGEFTEHLFRRSRLPVLEKRIYGIIDRAVAVEKEPKTKDFTPDAVNCSFCARLNCPARLALMGLLTSQWAQKPIELPHLNLLALSTPQLGALKKLTVVFKSFAAAVDAEAKRRAFDQNDIVEGYEIREKSGPRTVVNATQITKASEILNQEWNRLFNVELRAPFDWSGYVVENVELSIADLEKAIGKAAPRGKGELAKKIIVEALEKAGLISASTIFYLSAIKE